MMRIVLFGGSFNPPHLGHLKLALNSLKFLNAHELWFIPTLKSPLKDIELVDYEHRCSMIELLIKPYRKLKLSRIESELDEISYTYNTISILKNRYKNVEFIWLMGSDQALKFNKWFKYEELLKMIKFAVYRRSDNDQIDSRFIEVKSNELFENASQKIREGAVHLTDSKIVQYMIDHELYIEEIASSLMSKKRFEHTKSVCELALSLASHHDVNIHQVYIAALFHDCAKEWSTKKSKDWLSFVYPEYLNNHQALWHQKCGSAYVKRVLMVRDKKILNAISHHIEGFNDDVSKIVYIADKCERTRAYDSSVFINMAMSDLNKAYIEVRNAQVKWLEKERVTIG